MMKNKGSPKQQYLAALETGFIEDAAQKQAVEYLDQCFFAIETGTTVKGVYLHGPVGRGKTWLMDAFFSSLTVPARRQHFHHFIRWVHQRLFQLIGTADPLTVLAQELAASVKVLCFDELFVSDIGDASLLGGLFERLFKQGLVLIVTSNNAPDDLYNPGFNRERFLPAIAAIKQNMQIVQVDGGTDHRLHQAQAVQRFWLKNNADDPLRQVFYELSKGTSRTGALALNHIHIDTKAYSDNLLYCDFSQLCEAPLAAQDFIEIAQRFSVVLVANVPCLSGAQQEAKIARGTEDAAQQVKAGDRVLPQLAKHDDSVRRFIALVDECYDNRVAIYLEAQVPLEQIYTQGYLAFAFRRTFSRLQEMQKVSFQTK